MAEQYTINGTITLGDGTKRAGIRVQAFDRDLPSIELRTPPQRLGEEAVTNAEGIFQITYTLEQFQSGEAIPEFRKQSEQRADVTFLVLDRAARELNIEVIEALHRKYLSDEVIFNVPNSLEVSIFVRKPDEPGTSEYEQLLALIAPIVQDLPLITLSDKDVVFLTNELGLEQQREVQQRIEWLRRCALLTQETNLPVESFYGWGRKDVPASFTELATVPLTNLRSVLEKLKSLPDEELRRTLLVAIDENIIPASLRVRVDEIIRQLKRLDQVLHTVFAQLQNKETQARLPGYSVTTFDKDTHDENRGLDITDIQGRFSFSFYAPKNVPADASARKFSFQVVTPHDETVPVGEPTAISPNALEHEIVVMIKVPKPPAPSLDEQLQTAQIQTPDVLLEWLRTKDIRTFADIRRTGSLSLLPDLPQVNPAIISTLESLADLDRVSSKVQVSKALFDKGYDSVLAIAETPYSEFVTLVSDEKTDLTVREVGRLHMMSTVQTNLLNNILAGMAADVANGFNLPTPNRDT